MRSRRYAKLSLMTSGSETLRTRARRLIEDTQGAGRIFDLCFQSLIVASLVCFVLETEPNLGPETTKALAAFEVFSIVAFSLEYLFRLWASEKPLRYMFSFWGVVDVLAVLPYYLGGAVDLRSIRILRLLRLVRVLRLARYGAAARRFKRAFEILRPELTLFLVTTGMLIYIVAVGIYYCERGAQPESFGSIGKCLWWAIVTLTTVGYGDVYPITRGGQIFTSISLLIGLGVIAVPSGMVATALSAAGREEADRAE